MAPVRVLSIFLPAFVILAAPAAMAWSQQGATNNRADWLRIVPGDARFYIELNDLKGIRRRFQQLGIWRTVRELTEQDAPQTSQPWRRRSEELLGMSPEVAINQVLGRRSALIATGPGTWQSGVILAELDSVAEVQRLLGRWQAKRITGEGPVRRFLLRGDLLLAVQDRLLVIGPANDPEGLWARTVLLLSGKKGPHLRGRAEFAALEARLHGNVGGLAYIAWPPENPYAIAGCERLLLGFTVTEKGLRCEFHGQRQGSTELITPWKAELAGALPADTLAAWSGSFRPTSLRTPPAGTILDDRDSLIGLFVGMLSGLDRQAGNILDTLGPRVTIVLGPDAAAPADGFQLPDLTVVCEARDVQDHVHALDVLVSFFARLIEATTERRRESPLRVTVQKREVEGVELHYVAIGSVLPKRLGLPFLDKVEVCWAGMENALVFSSSPTHVANIIRAARHKARRLDESPVGPSVMPHDIDGSPTVQWTMLRGTEVSRMFTGWLDYLARQHPEALRDGWWQSWAADRLRRRARLGVALKDDPTNGRRAIVREIEPKSPAAEALRINDIIVSAAGRPLRGPQPAREVARRYEQRGLTKRFKIGVLRDGKPFNVEIPVSPVPQADLSDLRPIHALRQLVILLRRVQTVRMTRHGSDPNRFDVDMSVVWARSD
jgi:hypothetical protein